ncbi:MAG: SDR family oxidoreductase [Nocardioides sp.]
MSYLDELFSLRGKHAVVTGGSSGIGAAAAEALGRAGASVHVVARGQENLDATVAHLTDLGVEASAASYDLADAAQLAELCATDDLRRADILVNCAGVNHRPRLEDTTEPAIQETLDVNLMAPLRLGQAAGPRMAERGWGRIINVGSQQTWSAFGNSGVYGVAKAAIGGLTRSQAEAWSSRGVTSNALIPGFVVTPMTQATIAEPGREEALAERHLVKRNGVPADFASAVIFIAAPSSGFVTGHLLAVDGGFSVA